MPGQDKEIDPTSFTYHTTHLVLCDGQEYPTGSAFQHSDPAIIAQLRKAGAIVLREELERPEAIAQRQAELESENAALRAELARLQAQGATADVSSAAKAALAAAEAEAASAQPAKSSKSSKAAASSDGESAASE